MANTEPIQAPSPQETVSIADTLPKAPPPTPAPTDDGAMKLVKKVALAFQTVIDDMESRADARFYVIVERTWRPMEIIECATQEALQDCVHKLRAEVYELRQNRQNADMRISIFHGVRFHVQKWPYAALVHGKDMIPLDPLNDLEPVIDESGSLYEEPSLLNRSPRRDLRSPSVPAETLADAGPAEVVPGDAFSHEHEEPPDGEEELPPGENPQIID